MWNNVTHRFEHFLFDYGNRRHRTACGGEAAGTVTEPELTADNGTEENAENVELQEAETAEKKSLQPSLGGENSIIRRTQQYVQEHMMEKLTVPVVAQGVGVSASYLTALFHKHLSISPGEYIRRIKLSESKQLIREGQMNFTEISESLQYSTVHHFSRQFKQMFGMTPTEYAKSVR